jgi:hypothetical protein
VRGRALKKNGIDTPPSLLAPADEVIEVGWPVMHNEPWQHRPE